MGTFLCLFPSTGAVCDVLLLSVSLSIPLLEKDELQHIRYNGTEIFLPGTCFKKILILQNFVTQEHNKIYYLKIMLIF
jgi:hypothetical protein